MTNPSYNRSYISAAGNDGLACWSGLFYSNVDNQHQWWYASGQYYTNNYFDLAVGSSVDIVMQWADKWDYARSDYDVYLYDNLGAQVEVGNSSQGTSGSIPREKISFSHVLGDSYLSPFHIVLKKNINEGHTPINEPEKEIRLIISTSENAGLSYTYPNYTDSRSRKQIYGKEMAASVAVGAYPVTNTGSLEGYGSRGPSAIHSFDNNGVDRGSQPVNTPAIIATDGVETNAGTDFNPFFGTSAAAPHIAGIAALYYSKFPSGNFYTAITSSASSIAGGTGGTYNDQSGFGKADARECLIYSLTTIYPGTVSSNTSWTDSKVAGTVTINSGVVVTIPTNTTSAIIGTVNFGNVNSKIVVSSGGTIVVRKGAQVDISHILGNVILEDGIRLEQLKEDLSLLTELSIGRWEGGPTFAPYSVPKILPNEIPGSTEVIQANQGISSTSQKYYLWQDNYVTTSSILNHQSFLVQDSKGTYTAKFKTSYDATIQAQLLEGGAPGGTIDFIDPWFADNPDASHGNVLRNRGMDAIPNSVPYLSYNIGTSSAFKGVFLNQLVHDGIYYSVRAPLVPSPNINGFTGYFYSWGLSNASLQQVGSNPSGYDQKAVVFTGANATVTANYKMNLGSSLPTATGSTSQRKLIYCLSDKATGYHLVYESMGEVWYTRSTNGTTWSSEIRLSRGAGTAHNPAISELFEPYYGNSGIYVVWVDNTVRSGATGYDINVARLDPETNHWSPTEVIYDPSVPDAVGWAQAGARPVAMSFIDNSDLHVKVVIAYEGYSGATAGIISSAKAYYFNTGTVIWSQNLVCAAGGRPSMAFVSDASGNLSLALTYDDGSNVHIARSGNTLYSPEGCAYVCFNTPITVPSSIVVSPVKNSTVCFDGISGTIHVAWTGYALDYEMELTLERSQDLAGNWSSMNHFVSDLVEVPVMTATVSGDYDFGPTMLFSDGKVLFNMYASSGTNWSCKSLTSYYPSSATISSPNLLPKTDGVAASVLTFNSGSPGQLRFETRTNGALQKTSQPDSLKPVTKIYRQLSIKDTTDGSKLSVQYGDLVLTNESGTTIKNVAFEQSKNASKSSFVRTLPFQTGGNAFLDIQVKIDGQHWKKPGTVSFDLIDSASGKVLATLYTQNLLEGGGTQIEGRVKRNLQQLVGSRSVCIALHVDANDTAKFAVDYTQVYRIGAKSGLAKIGEPRQGEKYLASDNMPMEFRLLQNYPNPFNPSTQIAYQLKDAGSVHLAVYDMLGREVAVLVNEYRQAGYYSAVWNAAGLSSGAYIYRISVKDDNGKSSFNETKRMMLVK